MIRRENSDFLRQKQKQWEREKVQIAAESETRPEWFPFGENLTPGGGSPLRKFAPKEPVEQSVSPEKSSIECSMSRQSSSNNSTLNQEQHKDVKSGTPEKMEKFGRNPDPHQSAPPTHPYQPYPIYAFPMHHFPQQPLMMLQTDHSQDSSEAETAGTMLQNPAAGHHVFAPQYQVIPAGAIPVSTISIDPSQICPIDQMGMWTMPPPTGPNGMRYGIPIPAPFVPQIMTSSATSSTSHHHLNHQQAHQNTHMTTSSTDSSSESGVSGVKDDEEKLEKNGKMREEERQSTSDYTDDDPIPLTRRNTSAASNGCNYQEQIAERRRYEAEQENRERLELLEVERQRRILEDRRRDEEEKRKRLEAERLEEDRRRADQFAAAMEKARKEAELLKKAKLYKHVLRGADEEGEFEELEHKILGVDSETGRRLLKEVSDVEWHKKQDEVEIQKKAPPKETANTTVVVQQHRPRSSSIIVPSSPSSTAPPTTPFSRNTFGRRSVRTTSREKQQVTVVDMDKKIGEQLNRSSSQEGGSVTRRRSDQSPPPARPHHLPDSSHVSVSPESDCIIPYPPVAQSTPSRPYQHHNQQLITENNSTDPMLKSANFYCPINREPLSYREESRVISKPTTQNISKKFDSEWTRNGGNLNLQHKRENEITQSALFGPISTRLSTRRGQQMRGIGGIQSPPSVRCPASQQQRRTSSFEGSSSGGEDAGSISPDLSHKNFESPLPSSTENVHPAPNSPPQSKMDKNPDNGAGFEYGKSLRTRSALGSPMSMLNGGDSPIVARCASPSASRLMQRLESKGHVRRDDEHISQDVRRVAETNLSRSPSMASLRGSIQNLSIRGSHLNLAANSEGPSANLSKFASVNSPARQSLNSLRKTTDRQAAVLERLSRLRESLHAGKNFTPPRGTPTSRITTPAQTPPISPRPVL